MFFTLNIYSPCLFNGGKMDIEINDNNRYLVLLYKEYENTSRSFDRLNDRIIQLLSGGVAFLTILATIIYKNGESFTISIVLAWIIPFSFTLIFAIFMLMYYFGTDNMWKCRILSERLNLLLEEPVFIGHESGFPSNLFFSSRKGNGKLRLLYILLIFGAITIYFFVIVPCYITVNNYSHLHGTFFIIVYGFLILQELIILTGLYWDLPKIYKSYEKLMIENHTMPSARVFRDQWINQLKPLSLFYSIFPRPLDILVKFPYFWIGFLTTLFYRGLGPSRIWLVNKLFNNLTQWEKAELVPGWAIFLLGLIFFTLCEIFLEQAKLLWDDIRDRERDKLLPNNQFRALASDSLSIQQTILNLFFRLITSLLFALLLGGLSLFIIYLLIIFHQSIYVLWAKEKGEKKPLVPLFVVSVNLSLRFLAGVISANPNWVNTLNLMVFSLLYFVSFGGLSALWKIEAIYFINKNEIQKLRPQSYYFKSSGSKLQHIGLITTVVFNILILLFYLFLDKPEISLGYSFCYLVIGILASLLASIGIWKFFENWIIKMNVIFLRVKNILLFLFFSSTIVALILAIFQRNLFIFLLGLFFLNMTFLIYYEGMKYSEIDFKKIIQNLFGIINKFYKYIFNLDSSYTNKDD